MGRKTMKELEQIYRMTQYLKYFHQEAEEKEEEE